MSPMMSARQRNSRSFKRITGRLPPRRRILVVCEGAKTEPSYFKMLRSHHKLQTLEVDICGEECGSDPLSVVKFALERRDDMKSRKGGAIDLRYDETWCVMDVDTHLNLPKALELARMKDIRIALSNPCFEYWILLHFEKTDRHFTNCGSVIADLKRHIPNYTKGGNNASLILPHIVKAYERAAELSKNRPLGFSVKDRNSSTDVHILAGQLAELGRRPY